jgi:uncharacterized phiE125 gp8 family phage protein
MILTLVTAPAIEPITLQEAKDHMRVDHAYDDALIEPLITAAREMVESITRRALITQTWDYYLDTFPNVLRLPMSPLQSISSITYTDVDGASQTLSSAVYVVDSDHEPGRVYEGYSQSWPSTQSIRKAVKVRYVAGYGDAAVDVPMPIRQAMLLIIGHLYENREPYITGTTISKSPMAAESLLGPYRVVCF